MQQKFLKVRSLALLQLVIVANLQVLPANATYGASLPFFYLVALLGFFLPCVLMVAELATTRPQTGGAYIWCEQAFGPRVGFFTVSILWLSNLLWYPSVFSLIAANFAYLFNSSWAHHKTFIVSFSIILFWLFTGLNCLGIKFSSKTSVIFSVIGIIFPLVLIMVGGVVWWSQHHPITITFSTAALLPDLFHINNIGLLIGIVISLFGIEMTAVHAGNVVDPKRDYPKSLLVSSVLSLVLLILSGLAIATIVPVTDLNVVTGLLDTLTILLQKLHLTYCLVPLLFLVFLGNIGSIAAWMLGSTRGMYVACQKNQVTKFLQKTNRHEAPVGVLIFEAIIFTLVSSIFLMFPEISDSFWLMLTLASQVTLLYYIILFIAAIRLRYLPVLAPGFIIPGGNVVLWMIMSLGALTSFLALCIGFVPPENLDKKAIYLFHAVMVSGLTAALLVPIALLVFKKNRKILDCSSAVHIHE